MAAITICSDFGAQENKACHCFHCFLIYLPWSYGTRCHDLTFGMLNFKQAFSLSSFPFIKRLSSSSWLSAMRVVSSAYLRLLMFLPAFASPRPTFHMMYSADKLNEQCDNIQLYHTSFAVLNQSIVSCLILIVAFDLQRFLKRQVRWSGIPISFRISYSVLWSKQSKTLA